MTVAAQPKSLEEFMALPIRERFSQRIIFSNGKQINVPVAHQFNVLPLLDDDTLFTCFDADGECWRLAHDDDGYCRVRD